MPGTFIVRPIEANLTHNTDLIKKMNPYCSIAVGNTRIKGQICKHGGKHPHWNDSMTIPATGESKALLQLMDKDRITKDDNIGSCMLDLQEVQAAGQVSKWYPLYYKNKSAGEILLETTYQPDITGSDPYAGQNQYYASQNQYYADQGQYYGQERLLSTQPEIIQREEVIKTAAQPEIIQKEETITRTTTEPALVQQETIATDSSLHSHVWTEQKQVVQPHTFFKEVEVVETRPAMKEIEVMEPVKVMKEVPFTQAVPVKKQIEVSEPQVVRKEVEVIEPRLVTKTIQVVENVPVTRQVEVVEMKNAIQEVETMEPQSFTKQIEVTEYMPVKKNVEVSQPVTLKKAVEFVEPIITTQTITKELQQPVIINEEITKSVGPATVVGMSQEYGYYQNYGEISLTERQRLAGLQRWIGFERLFNGLTEEERFFEQQRLSRLNEQEWFLERQRLSALSDEQRLLEQRRLYNDYYKSKGFLGGHKRYHGFERFFHGLNEKERQFELERLNRLNDEEWLLEQKRLSAFNDQQRLLEQRRLYNDYLKTGGFTTYKKSTETIEQTTTY